MAERLSPATAKRLEKDFALVPGLSEHNPGMVRFIEHYDPDNHYYQIQEREVYGRGVAVLEIVRPNPQKPDVVLRTRTYGGSAARDPLYIETIQKRNEDGSVALYTLHFASDTQTYPSLRIGSASGGGEKPFVHATGRYQQVERDGKVFEGAELDSMRLDFGPELAIYNDNLRKTGADNGYIKFLRDKGCAVSTKPNQHGEYEVETKYDGKKATSKSHLDLNGDQSLDVVPDPRSFVVSHRLNGPGEVKLTVALPKMVNMKFFQRLARGSWQDFVTIPDQFPVGYSMAGKLE